MLVKLSPPRGTPFGERWHDLLHAEHLALSLLRDHGMPVAASLVVETPQRTYLESTRFDRVGLHGRRHVVPLHAVHDAFVPGPRRHWGDTCEALARQRRLPAEAARQAQALLHFGHLIGNRTRFPGPGRRDARAAALTSAHAGLRKWPQTPGIPERAQSLPLQRDHKVLPELKPFGCKVLKTSLSNEQEARLKKALEDATSPAHA